MKHRFPTAAHVVHARLDHLAEAADDQLADLRALGAAHDDHERPERHHLEVELGHLVALEELGAQLPQRVDGVHGHLQVVVAALDTKFSSGQETDATAEQLVISLPCMAQRHAWQNYFALVVNHNHHIGLLIPLLILR